MLGNYNAQNERTGYDAVFANINISKDWFQHFQVKLTQTIAGKNLCSTVRMLSMMSVKDSTKS